MTFLKLAAATAAAVLLAGPVLAQPAPAPAAPAAPVAAPTADVLDTLKAKGNFTTLLALIDAAELGPTLKSLPNFTMFAPTDQAFAALAPGIVDGWKAPDHKEGLQRLILYHVVNANYSSSVVAGKASEVPTGAGTPVKLDGSQPDGKIHINGQVAVEEIKATNGDIYVIDKVLAPR